MKRLVDQLVRDEGLVLHPYRCEMGKLTIGVGHNLDAKPITRHAAIVILQDDIKDATGEVGHYLPWTEDLDDARKAALINLAFNMGIAGLLKFVKFLRCMQDRDYVAASWNLLDSKYAQQVPERAWRVAEQIKTGKWQMQHCTTERP